MLRRYGVFVLVAIVPTCVLLLTREELLTRQQAIMIRPRGQHESCDPWSMETLRQLAPGVDPDAILRQSFTTPIGLGYTVAPVECLHDLAWDTAHLVNATNQYNLIFMLHAMKTAGTALREVFFKYASKQGYCKWYSAQHRMEVAEANVTKVTDCTHKFHGGHLAQNNYHLKFTRNGLSTRRGLYFLMLRDPLIRAMSVYHYFKLPGRVSLDEFFTAPRDDGLREQQSFWAVDIFWYLGVRRPRSTDTVEQELQTLERCQFAIRSMLVLISERFLESVALLSVVLGGDPSLPVKCSGAAENTNTRFSDPDSFGFNVTRSGARFAMRKLRWARILYEYAHLIFDRRLEQFGIRDKLRATCTEAELKAGGFGHPTELAYLDNILDVLP